MKVQARLAALVAVLLGAALLSATPSCKEKRDDGTSPAAAGDLPELSLKDETPDLMLTWIDGRGATHVEVHVPDVPAEGRDLVRVVVSDKADGTRELFYVADLSKKDATGAYTVRTMRRSDWEAVIEKRRGAEVAKNTPPPPAQPGQTGEPGAHPPTDPGKPPVNTQNVTVIIYGASWCGPCHQAAAHLRSKGVAFVQKDIEETPGARAEMQAKLEKVGRRGGSIPVIDVRGEILVGFSPGALDRALAKLSGGGTVL